MSAMKPREVKEKFKSFCHTVGGIYRELPDRTAICLTPDHEATLRRRGPSSFGLAFRIKGNNLCWVNEDVLAEEAPKLHTEVVSKLFAEESVLHSTPHGLCLMPRDWPKLKRVLEELSDELDVNLSAHISEAAQGIPYAPARTGLTPELLDEVRLYRDYGLTLEETVEQLRKKYHPEDVLEAWLRLQEE